MAVKGSTLTPRRKKSRQTKAGSRLGGVQVTNLVKYFGDNLVLDHVSFEIPEGSVCTLLGASGSGKTTTLRLLAGLEVPDDGEVWIGGERMASAGKAVPGESREVGLVFQSYALWPHMTVYDQIAYPLTVRGASKEATTTAVETNARMVGLGELLDRYPSELSGGQQQRVALARALVFDPRLLLLDEPLSNLDEALRRETRLELQRLQERVKVTTVYVTHDQQEAMAVSDIVVVMDKGKVVAVDSPRALYDRPTSVFVASFVGSSNLLDGKVAEVGSDHVRVTLGDGTTVQGVSPHDLRVGESAVVAVKPGDVAVAKPDDAAVNSIPATVLHSTYLGDQAEFMLDVVGQDFRASLPRWEVHADGDDLELVVPPDQVTVLRPD